MGVSVIFWGYKRRASYMSRRGNCHDNVCAASFFGVLKKERIRRRIYPTREAAKVNVFNYIELFHNQLNSIKFNAMGITMTYRPWSLKITIL